MLQRQYEALSRLKMPPLRQLTVVAAVACTFALFLVIWSYSSSADRHVPEPLNPAPLKSFVPPYGAGPLSSSWKQWFSPQGWTEGRTEAEKGGRVDEDWNIYYHLGGNGPWIPKLDGIVTNDTAPPEGCTATQVHMLSRHAERFPTVGSAQRMIEVVAKIRTATSSKIEGDLSFLNHWTMFVQDPETELEQLTKTGPYAGTLESFTTGVKYRTRYDHLIRQLDSSSRPLKVFAASGARVVDTAKYFSLGLFGLAANTSAQIEAIPEDETRGGNTLTPADTCLAYIADPKGHDYGDTQMTRFRSTYLRAIASRLRSQLSVGRHVTIDFSDDEVYAMQEMCGYETIARGKSPWCDVFSKDEWESFEYARDVLHFYRSGPGNNFGRTLGSLWLNATGMLLADAGLEETVDAPFFFSFTHDSDLVPIFAILDLNMDGPNHKLPNGYLQRDRNWRMSSSVPMGGRITFERLSCSMDDTQESKGIFVRLNINDGIVAIPGCAQGPGLSCPIKNFLTMLDERLADAGDFAKTCELPDGLPEHIEFLHQ